MTVFELSVYGQPTKILDYEDGYKPEKFYLQPYCKGKRNKLIGEAVLDYSNDVYRKYARDVTKKDASTTPI